MEMSCWPCGLMDKASVSGAEDCGFESHQGRIFCKCMGIYVSVFPDDILQMNAI